MIRILLSCGLITLLLNGNAVAQAPKANNSDLKAMYEDIEILRRILMNELSKTPASSQGNANSYYDNTVRRGLEWLGQNQYGYAPLNTNTPYSTLSTLNAANYSTINSRYSSARLGGSAMIEGAYLKGHGVSYTLALHGADQAVYDPQTKGTGLISICMKCHAPESADRYLNSGGPSRATPKLSDWERIRKEVHGEKTEPEPSVAATFRMQSICAPGNLTEKILKVLAENGHNFQQLQLSENISVVISFGMPRVEATDSYRKTGNTPAVLKNAEEQAAMGDAELKQQKQGEAVRHYDQAIRQLSELGLSMPSDMKYETARQIVDDANKLLRSCYLKKAQALLSAGMTTEAKDALANAESAFLKVKLPKETPESKVSPHLPAKLLITVSKKSLDEHRAGKQSLEDFRKAAEIQSINLPPAERK